MIAPLCPDDPQELGPYRLSGLLGGGGMGRVFLARSADGKPVAVKVIRPELAADREFRTRFRQEVAAARNVSGMYTALVVDADPDAPVPWLATDYVAGPSLAEAVDSHGPLPVSEVLSLAAGLAEGLIAIHAVGVVHCDLKPSNILLAEDGPRIIDFGICRAAWASAMPDADFGSPAFMSPEHVLGYAIGPPSDIFSLGAVLAFAATGEGPFGSGPSAALIYRVVNSPACLDSLPGEVRGLVARCLAKDPDERPTASRLLTHVEAIERENEMELPALAGVSSGASAAGLSAVEPQPGREHRDLRRRFSRSLPLFVPGLLAAAAVAVYIMSGGIAPAPATLSQSQAGAATASSTGLAQPQGAGTAATPQATVTRGRSVRPDRIGPSVAQNPFSSVFLSTSPVASGLLLVPSPSPSPSSSGSGSASPSPSPSPSSSGSGSASASPSPSPSPSTSSPSPSPSTSSPSPSPSTSSAFPSPSSSSPTAPATSTSSTPVSTAASAT